METSDKDSARVEWDTALGRLEAMKQKHKTELRMALDTVKAARDRWLRLANQEVK